MTHTGKLWEAARHDQSDPGQQYLSIRTFWHIVFPSPARGSRRAGTSQGTEAEPSALQYIVSQQSGLRAVVVYRTDYAIARNSKR